MSRARRLVALAPSATIAGSAALGQAAQVAWLVLTSRTTSASLYGAILSGQALYLMLQTGVDWGSWFYGARAAAISPVDDVLRGGVAAVRLLLAVAGAAFALAFGALAGGEVLTALAPYCVALLLFASMNTWEPFGSGRRAPFVAYLVLRSVVPATAAAIFLVLGRSQPAFVAGLAECFTVLVICATWRLRPLAHLRLALRSRRPPLTAVLRLTAPQAVAQVVMTAGTLSLSLAGAAAEAAMVAAGVKVLAGFNTLVGSAALGFFRSFARGEERSGPGAGVPAVAVLALASGASVVVVGVHLAAPLLTSALLNSTAPGAVTTLRMVSAALPASALVVGLTSALVARGLEATLLRTYSVGAAAVLLVAIVANVAGHSSANAIAAGLTFANVAMAVHVLPKAGTALAAAPGGLAAGAVIGVGASVIAGVAAELGGAAGAGLAIAILPCTAICAWLELRRMHERRRRAAPALGV